ncbi:MAG: hypothetical protein Q8Q09_18785 [Deltaproteobacteria bacterium]|nr:hypothetical protein [Deltaproteobacteria bacterium]
MDTPNDDLLDRPALPATLQTLSDACHAFVLREVGVALDDTPDTLPLLDHALALLREAKPEVQSLIAAAAGAYWGELIRALYPARWVLVDDDKSDWRLELEQVFLALCPEALALEAIAGQDATPRAAFIVRDEDRPLLSSALELLGEVDQDDYYRLSTRFDIVSSIIERLTAKRQTQLESQDLPLLDEREYHASRALHIRQMQ